MIENLKVEEVHALQKKHPQGMSTQEIISFLKARQVKFSEDNFRKYIQLDLLPRSFRIGKKGKHKGSSGRYPVYSITKIIEIKNLLEEGATIENILNSAYYYLGEVEELQTATNNLLEKINNHSADDLPDAAELRGILGFRLGQVQKSLQEAKKRLRQFKIHKS